MPLYETASEGGRMSIRLKAHQFADQDIQNYGPLERSDQELLDRARYHVEQKPLPTPQAVLADDLEAFTRMIVEFYPTIYKGLLVAYTGLKEPFCLTVEPRYTTSVNLDDTEDEHPFTGLAGLQAIIKKEQDQRRKAAQDDECSPDIYLLTMVQVSIYDGKEANLEWYEKPNRFLCYDLDGDQITRSYEQTDISDDILRGLGLPFAETIASANREV